MLMQVIGESDVRTIEIKVRLAFWLSSSEGIGRLLGNTLEDLEISTDPGINKRLIFSWLKPNMTLNRETSNLSSDYLKEVGVYLKALWAREPGDMWSFQVYLDLYKDQGQFGEAQLVLRQLISISTAAYRENFHYRHSPPPLYRLRRQLAEVCKPVRSRKDR